MIDAKQIAIYNLERSPAGVKISKLELSEDGYIKGWVPSFSKIENELMKDFLKNVPNE